MSLPPHISGHRTYRQVAVDDFGILMCGSHLGCNKKLSLTTHKTGKVDGAGVIHDAQADVIPRRPGFRRFLLLIGWSTHDREWERLPRWERLYRANVWAFKEARKRFHYQIPAAQSRRDRELAHRDAVRRKAKVRTTNFPAYLWMVRRLYTGTPS